MTMNKSSEETNQTNVLAHTQTSGAIPAASKAESSERGILLYKLGRLPRTITEQEELFEHRPLMPAAAWREQVQLLIDYLADRQPRAGEMG